MEKADCLLSGDGMQIILEKVCSMNIGGSSTNVVSETPAVESLRKNLLTDGPYKLTDGIGRRQKHVIGLKTAM